MNLPSLKTTKEPDALQDILTDLARHGRPTLGIYSAKSLWHCSLELNTNPVGVQFKIASDFQQPTPLAAAQQCRERLREALASIGRGAV